MMREIFIRANSLNLRDYLQLICDNKITQYNSTTKHTLRGENRFFPRASTQPFRQPPQNKPAKRCLY